MNRTLAFYCQGDKRVKKDYFLTNYDETNEYVRLKIELENIGYEVHSLDVFQKQKRNPNICIFLDIPTFNINKVINKKYTKSIAMLREAELINPINYDKNISTQFNIILTWKRELLDNKKYYFFPSTRFVKKHKIDVENYLDRKLCVLINSN